MTLLQLTEEDVEIENQGKRLVGSREYFFTYCSFHFDFLLSCCCYCLILWFILFYILAAFRESRIYRKQSLYLHRPYLLGLLLLLFVLLYYCNQKYITSTENVQICSWIIWNRTNMSFVNSLAQICPNCLIVVQICPFLTETIYFF